MQEPHRGKGGDKKSGGGGKTQEQQNQSAQQRQVNALVAQALAQKGVVKGKGKVKGKFESKGKGKWKNDNSAPMAQKLPLKLVGMQVNKNGKRICFPYHLEGCPDYSVCGDGKQCRRGWHICCVPGCDGAHLLDNCPNRK